MLGFLSQHTGKDGVKGSHIQITGILHTHQLSDTVFHLPGSLIGKGQSQYLPGLDTLLQQVSNLVGKYTCLSRAGTRNDKRRSFTVFHSLPLSRVQVV